MNKKKISALFLSCLILGQTTAMNAYAHQGVEVNKNTINESQKNFVKEDFTLNLNPSTIVYEDQNSIVYEDETGITIINKLVKVSNNNADMTNYESQYEAANMLASSRFMKVKNHKYLGTVVMDDVLERVSAVPGIAQNLNVTESVSASITGTLGASKSDITAEVGFSVSKSYSVSHGGTYTAPAYHNGKKVKRVELLAKPLCEKHSYQVYLDPRRGPDVIYGTEYAYKPVGIHFDKEFIYE